jgi:hypothetical protein
MKFGAGTAVVILALALPATALALATETFGNAPMGRQPEWAVGVVDVVNLKTRVYSFWVNGNESFFYRGNAQGLNEALRTYAAVKDDVRRLILRPGPGKRESFQRKPIDFDWQLDVPSGIYRAMTKRKHAEMTVYISATRPRPVERAPVEKWLRELSSDAFKTRESATQELQKLGSDAKPFLREALKAQPTLEARRRVETLLERLRGLDVTDLDIPKGLTVITVDESVDKGLKELKAADRDVRSMAVQDLGRLARYSEQVAPALVEVFQKDQDEHVRRTAAANLAHYCAREKAVIPVMKEGLNDRDAYVRDAFKTALERAAKAKEAPGEEEQIRRERAIVRDIAEFKRAAGGGK